MLRNYILIAFRSLLKNKLFSFINIFGLALSVSVCMIVLVRLVDALAYDTFHDDRESIYRITSSITTDGNTRTLASTPLPLGDALQADSKDIIATHIYPAIQLLAKDRQREFNVKGTFIEPSFFSVFGFTCQRGNGEKAMAMPRRVLLSQAMATKFYGTTDPTGKTLTLGDLGEFEVMGVLLAAGKSHINYDVYVSMATVAMLEGSGHLPKRSDAWDAFDKGYTYIKLDNNTSLQSIEGKLARIATEITRTATDTKKSDQPVTIAFALQSLASITPVPSDIYYEISRGPSQGSLLGEAGIAFIILLAATFNYTNLSVARALTRGKEVGIRKLSGAQRWQIFAQYITEAIMIAFLASFVATAILSIILEFKPFNDDYEMVPAVTIGTKLVLVFGVFSILVGLLAGAVPAWILSSFRPARILRGIGTEKIMGNLSFRKVLMVFQFSLSLIILVFLATFYQQFDFLGHADPGFHQKDIVLIPADEHPEVTAAAFKRLSGIQRTAFTSERFGQGETLKASTQISDPQALPLETYTCNHEWIDMMRLTFVAGTYFQAGTAASIINEKAVTALGFPSASDAVGSVIYLQDSIRTTISGVVKDFYTQGYGNPIRPLLLLEAQTNMRYIALEAPQHTATLQPLLETEWKKQNPGHLFDPRWLDAEMELKADQSAMISLLGFLSIMTVTIASLGLLGLVVYTVETRRKEISIRKIIGASVQQVVVLLSKSFVKLLVIAALIALPIGYILSNLFLLNFVNRITVGISALLCCFCFLMGIGLIVILSQTWRASLENPARNLKSD